jgi:hypothetical protein
MARNRELKEQLQREQERRTRLGVPVTASGVLYLLGAIILYQALLHLPTVGILQGLQRALGDHSLGAVSPQAAEVKYLSHHAFGLIAGSLLQAIAYVFLVLALLLLLDATRLRSQEQSVTVRRLVLFGGIGTAIIVVAGQIVRAVRTHEFAVGHNFTQHAVEHAVTKGTANVIAGYLGLLLPVVLVVGMILTVLRATRVGLLPRWMRNFGIVAAILLLPIFAQAFELQIIAAAWIVALGLMFLGRLPSGDPPAWASGEAMPWPSTGGRRVAAQESGGGDGGSRAELAAANGSRGGDGAGELDDAAVAEAPPAGTRKRRRKRGS